MAFIRSLGFSIAFYIWSVVVVLGFMPIYFMSWPQGTWMQRLWSRGVLFIARVFVGISYEVKGLEHLPEGSCIIACKHQSTFETLALSCILKDAAYVVKKELMQIPFFGWYGWPARHIPVDRKAGAKALRYMFRAASRAKEDGRRIAIFPEGTRTAVGAKPAYQPGIVALYRHLGLPVVPVAVNSGLFWGRGQFVKKPGRITIEFLPIIESGLDKRRFMSRLETEIESATKALVENPA
ncbi:MAG: lysophospholipid acyltransferase family protein [Sphingomonadales bacterium]|jgi:1-acyl-sn-glycerol-3-phosphate acyltransferase